MGGGDEGCGAYERRDGKDKAGDASAARAVCRAFGVLSSAQVALRAAGYPVLSVVWRINAAGYGG